MSCTCDIMGDMAEKQAKIKEKQENMAETNQKWQKNRQKLWKSFHFCCQGPTFVLPMSHIPYPIFVLTPVYRGALPRRRWTQKRTYREGVSNHTGHYHGVGLLF